MDKLIEKISKQFESISVLISFIASIISILSLFWDKDGYFIIGFRVFVVLYFVIISFYITKSLLNVSKAKRKITNEFMNNSLLFSNALHSYYHNLRNRISMINEMSTIEQSQIKDFSQILCSYIAEIYTALLKQYLENNKISVCIKLIKINTNFLYDNNYMNWQMETIARSPSTSQERINIDEESVEISKNSDFQIIISDKYGDNIFSSPDMRNIKRDFLETYKIEYNNSRGDNFIEYYRSTIVAPIKISGSVAEELGYYIKRSNKKNIYLGFLCIDSMKVFESDDEIKAFNLGIAYSKSLADSLYLFFEKVLIYNFKNDIINDKRN